MNMKTKGLGRKKKVLTPEQLQARQQRAHIVGLRKLFQRLGFAQCKADGVEFTFCERTGEIDDIFVYENVLLLVEYTSGKKSSEHLAKKKILYDLIYQNKEEFVRFAKSTFGELQSLIKSDYTDDCIRVCIIYASSNTPNEEIARSCENVKFLFGATEIYFKALAATIEKSARIEFFKFLGLSFKDVGKATIKASRSQQQYDGYLLPESHSHYPEKTKIVSFYADPESLMEAAYVLRRDSWRDSEHLYQRILEAGKIKQMRKYLADEKRVFVNNIIVTLPSDTQLNHQNTQKNLTPAELSSAKPVTIGVPINFDTIGIIDGQHRIFCYHEGCDIEEKSIAPLRSRQHLLVTGIIFPDVVDEATKRNYEARLFLEINDKQKRVRAGLKQDIEVQIRPASATAIAKRIMQLLGKSGPYREMLQTNYFDPPTKIKTSSIVNYGLRPLVKFNGEDSLFSSWSNPKKEVLHTLKPSETSPILDDYVDYCVTSINQFFLAVKEKYGYQNGSWDMNSSSKSPLLSVTVINGLINSLRIVIANKLELSLESHQAALKNVNEFDFTAYKSSHWRQLGEEFFAKHYRND